MLLTIDIGNTNIVSGVFEGDTLRFSWRLSTRREQTKDEYAVLFGNLFSSSGLDAHLIQAVLISSVVPPLDECFESMVWTLFSKKASFVRPEKQNLVPVLYRTPSDVGADRIVNALAAYTMYGGPGVVVDFGTATTFDAISGMGEYLGGIIAPGVKISAEALFQRTAKLPRIDIRKPEELVGRSTTVSIQSGLYYGYVGLVEGILKRMELELGDPTITATGGLAPLISQEIPVIDRVEENLTLHGLRFFFQRTKHSLP